MHRLIWKDLFGVVILALFSGGLGVWVHNSCKPGTPRLMGIAHPAFSLEQFQAYVEEKRVLILDARNESNFKEGHVPGALSLPAGDFERAYERMKPVLAGQEDKLIIVYCVDIWCGQADLLQQKLVNYGFHHVGVFPDGWSAWINAGLPVEKKRDE